MALGRGVAHPVNRHVLAGRAFVLGMCLVVPMGLTVRYPPDVESILVGTLVFLFTGGVGILSARRRFGGPTVAARGGALTGVA